MTANDLEKNIEQRFVKYVAASGDECIKIERRHWPDRLVLMDGGNHFFIEFKRAGESLRIGQKEQRKRLMRMGHTVYVCDNYRDAVEFYKHEKAI